MLIQARTTQQRLVPALITGAAVLTLLAGAALLCDLTRLEFTAQDHAYGSIFYLLAGYLLALAVVGLAIDGVVHRRGASGALLAPAFRRGDQRGAVLARRSPPCGCSAWPRSTSSPPFT